MKVSSKRHRRRSLTLAFIRANPCYKCFHKKTKLTQPKLLLFLEVLPVVSDFKTTPIKQRTTEKRGGPKCAMQRRGTAHAHLFFYFLVSRSRPSDVCTNIATISQRGVKEKQDQFVGRGDSKLHLHVIECKIRENSQNFSENLTKSSKIKELNTEAVFILPTSPKLRNSRYFTRLDNSLLVGGFSREFCLLYSTINRVLKQ